MIDPVLLFELLLLLVISAVGLALFESLRLPAIVGFLVVGALAGPGGLQLVDEPEENEEARFDAATLCALEVSRHEAGSASRPCSPAPPGSPHWPSHRPPGRRLAAP